MEWLSNDQMICDNNNSDKENVNEDVIDKLAKLKLPLKPCLKDLGTPSRKPKRSISFSPDDYILLFSSKSNVVSYKRCSSKARIFERYSRRSASKADLCDDDQPSPKRKCTDAGRQKVAAPVIQVKTYGKNPFGTSSNSFNIMQQNQSRLGSLNFQSPSQNMFTYPGPSVTPTRRSQKIYRNSTVSTTPVSSNAQSRTPFFFGSQPHVPTNLQFSAFSQYPGTNQHANQYSFRSTSSGKANRPAPSQSVIQRPPIRFNF